MTNQYFENVLVKMYGEDTPQPVTVSIGGNLTNTEDFDYDGMVFFYFQNEAEFRSSFSPHWDGSDGSFYTLATRDSNEGGDYKPFSVMATRITNYGATVWARSQEEAEKYLDSWIVDDFTEVGQEFSIDEVCEVAP